MHAIAFSSCSFHLLLICFGPAWFHQQFHHQRCFGDSKRFRVNLEHHHDGSFNSPSALPRSSQMHSLHLYFLWLTFLFEREFRVWDRKLRRLLPRSLRALHLNHICCQLMHTRHCLLYSCGPRWSTSGGREMCCALWCRRRWWHHERNGSNSTWYCGIWWWNRFSLQEMLENFSMLTFHDQLCPT